MNLNFNNLFDKTLDDRNDDSFRSEIDRPDGDTDQIDYQRDAEDEHYISEYRYRDADETEADLDSEATDRFSHEGRYYDRGGRTRFGRGGDDG